MIGRAFALLLLLVATGCVTMGMGNVEKLGPEHRTLVVSVLGDNFQVESIGTTIFQVWRKTEDVSNWGVDDRVEARIQKELTRSGRVAVIPFDTQQLRSTVGNVDTNDLTGGRKITEGMKALTRLGRSAGADSILLVSTSPSVDFFRKKYTIEGYGIYQSSSLGLRAAVTYVCLQIWLIDTDSGDDIARIQRVRRSPRQEADWLEESYQLSETAWFEIRAGFEALLDATVREGLEKLSLIQR